MKTRRRFLQSLVGSFGAAALDSRIRGADSGTVKSLIPQTRSIAPNYWCTWAAQNYLYGQGTREFDVRDLEGSQGAEFARESLCEKVLVGPQGWSKSVHPKVREELYLLLDDGWAEGGSATFRLDREKFPSFRGSAPDRLRALNDTVRHDGWRALALWISEPAGGNSDYQHMRWVKSANIPYLKVDGGDLSGTLAEARARLGASIQLEHVYGEPPFNGDWQADGRFETQSWNSERIRILRAADVYRTYDATAVLGVPTTLDRVGELMRVASGRSEVRALLNVEDEVYIAAVLGCCMGVMRHPFRGLRAGKDPDVFLPLQRGLKRRMDEVLRAIRWQRLAPPYAVGIGEVALDTRIITDEWVFESGETFDASLVSHRAKQGAPARIARNMDLPIVSCLGDPPYVACARFPGGAASIGAFERSSVGREIVQPRANVRWLVGDASGPLGIFGRYESLTLVLNRPLRGGRIIAQDLAGDSPVDITENVERRAFEYTLSGALIDRVGSMNATVGDLSMPGVVLAL